MLQTSSASYETAIISEAHGLISDMLADSSLPPHVISGLRVVGNLLKPTETHPQLHKPKVSPLVSLTETANYGSDNEDLPYTGERPSSLPKVRGTRKTNHKKYISISKSHVLPLIIKSISLSLSPMSCLTPGKTLITAKGKGHEENKS